MKLARIFQSYCVLQRNKEAVIFGSCEENEEVIVRLLKDGVLLAEVKAETKDRRFEAKLPAQKEGRGFTLEVKGAEETVTLEDIWFGEVWLLGGQSNMEFLMKYDARREEVKASLPEYGIRFYEVPKVSYEGQMEDEDHSDEGIWRKGETYDDVKLFSAVGFYFARKVRETIGDVPFGLIGCNWGGASAACFTNEKYLVGDLQGYLDLRKNSDGIDVEKEFEGFKKSRQMQRTPEALARLDHMMENAILKPMHFDFPKEMIEAFRRTKYAPFSQFRPCGLYDTMIMTVAPYPLAGFLWYQGEEDSAFPELNYAHLMNAMITCWREEWRDEDLPFIFAQLPTYENPGGFNNLDYVPIRAWQDENSRTTKNAYMVVILDAGMRYEIHPKQKRPVGERMAFQALKHVYGYPATHAEAPGPKDMIVETGKVTVGFVLDSSDAALTLQDDIKDALVLKVNGEEAAYQAAVEGNKLIIKSDKIRLLDKIEVSYGMKGFFAVSVFDTKGLPARPFVAAM